MRHSRSEYRNAIQSNGMWLYRETINDTMQNIVGEIMALNEEYCLNHPETIGESEIWDNGFTPNQIRWIEKVNQLLKKIEV